MSIFRRRDPDPDWAAIDRENEQGMDIFARAVSAQTDEELRALWQEANSLVGKRAPAEAAPFLAYGYIEGRREAIRRARP